MERLTAADKPTRKTLTEEQKAKMKGGRKARKARREQKMAEMKPSFDSQRREFGRTALPLVEKAERASLKSAIHLKCLDCTCHQPGEIRNCHLVGCPLWPFRPYQPTAGKPAIGEPSQN